MVTAICLNASNAGGRHLEKTLIVVKPDAVERGLVGVFLARFERMGMKIAGIKAISGERDVWEKFYPSDAVWLEHVGSLTAEDCRTRGFDLKAKYGTRNNRDIGLVVKARLVDHMSSGLAVAVVLIGIDCRTKVRITCGATLPNKAAPGTIRFDFASDSPNRANDENRPLYNLIHASEPSETRDDLAAADFEIDLIFGG